MRIISPSTLSADFGNLQRDIEMLQRSAAEWIHIDVMDGLFVPNISFGFPVINAIRKYSDKVLDVHLMIVEPERYIDRFIDSGADYLTIHIEATEDAKGCLEKIRSRGIKAGISIKPATSVELLEELLPLLDLVLIMSVEPGFGGQSFMEGSIEKVVRLKQMIVEGGYSTLIEVDGGISSKNARRLFDAGADALVAGNAVFGAADPEAEIVNMLNS